MWPTFRLADLEMAPFHYVPGKFCRLKYARNYWFFFLFFKWFKIFVCSGCLFPWQYHGSSHVNFRNIFINISMIGRPESFQNESDRDIYGSCLSLTHPDHKTHNLFFYHNKIINYSEFLQEFYSSSMSFILFLNRSIPRILAHLQPNIVLISDTSYRVTYKNK